PAPHAFPTRRSSDLEPVGALVRRAAATLAAAGSPTPRLDAELLLAHVLGVERLALHASPERLPGAAERAAYDRLIERRRGREPVDRKSTRLNSRHVK